MKKLSLLAALILLAGIGFAQSFVLSNSHGEIPANSAFVQVGTPDSVELVTYLNVKNVSGVTKDVLCKKVEIKMLDSTEVSMCWAGGCYGTGTFVSPNAASMAAGSMNTEFSGHYTQSAFTHFQSGESIIRWVFFDRANPNDSASVTVKYTTYPAAIAENSMQQASLSALYPNPAPVTATCSYTIPGGAFGQIVVRDMLGSVVRSIDLSSGSGKATVNTVSLADGIYFCSLLVDGKVSQTKKMVVRH